MSEVITCKSRDILERRHERLLAWLSLCFLQARHEWAFDPSDAGMGWERRAVGYDEIYFIHLIAYILTHYLKF